MRKAREYEFDVFIDASAGVNVAYAMNVGLVTTAEDLETAMFKMGKLLVCHIAYAEKHNCANLIYRENAVPEHVMEKFKKFRNEEHCVESKTRTINFDSIGLRLNQKTYATAAPCPC